ncbi:MAG TPA: hypothetical protein VEC16_02885 [Alphaproteobacteria bacterium]|nr:hypothetical protein [Alphaproteobacteria bacterium]
MVGNKLEQSIVAVFQDDLSSTFSINQVSKILKKSYPIINKKSNNLLEEGILRKINVGRSYQCSLNMSNEKARILVALNEIDKKNSFIQKNKHLVNVTDEIIQLSKKFNISTVILNKNNLLFVLDNLGDKKDILEITTLTRDYILSFYDLDSFRQKFLSDHDLRKYHFVLYNTDIYANIVASPYDELIVKNIFGKDKKKTDSKEENKEK